ATPAQKGKVLGTSGPTADWPCTHLQPGGQCDSTAAEHEHQERGNPLRALRGSLAEQGPPDRRPGGGGAGPSSQGPGECPGYADGGHEGRKEAVRVGVHTS